MSKEERLQLENELLLTCSKAQAINNYIDELEESSKLSELWCKSQEENRDLQQRISDAIEYIKHSWWLRLDQVYDTSKDLKGWEVEQLLEILKGGNDD